jgi:hypothetical protein
VGEAAERLTFGATALGKISEDEDPRSRRPDEIAKQAMKPRMPPIAKTGFACAPSESCHATRSA